MDDKDKAILEELLTNSRIPYKELGRKRGISDTTIHFRVQRLIRKGIIKAFTVSIDYPKTGLENMAMLTCTVGGRLLEEFNQKRAQEKMDALIDDSRVAFIALGKDGKTLVVLVLMDTSEELDKVVNGFKGDPDFESVHVTFISDIKKERITTIRN